MKFIQRYPVTSALIAINALVFAFFSVQQGTVLFTKYQDFLALFWAGANFNPFNLGSEPWRIFTSLFLHGNILHLVMNMYGLYVIGQRVEEDEGGFRMLMLYLITGVCGGLASIELNLFAPGVGASGAIFGLYGYLITRELLLRFRDRDELINIVVNFVIFMSVNYLIALGVNKSKLGFGIDVMAHTGGLFSGIALAVVARFVRLPAMVLLLLLVIVYYSKIFLPTYQRDYYNMFQQMVNTEKRLGKLFEVNLTDHQFADSLREIATSWDSVAQKLNALKHVPEELHNDTAMLHQYVALRKNAIVFQIQEIDKESYVYLDSIEITSAKLDSLPRLEYVLNYKISPPRPEPDTTDKPEYETSKVFFDKDWNEVEERTQAKYFRIGQRDSLGRWQGKARDYFLDGRIQMKGAYKDGMNHGVFLYYTADQKYESAGRYNNDEPVGKWETYHKNGKLHTEMVYNNMLFIKNVYDSAGNVQVRDGNGREVEWYANGVVEEEGEIRNGRREGLWKGNYSNGKPRFEEYYVDNRLMRGMAMDPAGNRYIYDQSSYYPFPEIGLKAYDQYLKENLRRPDVKGVEGKVRLNFTVTDKGVLKDFVVIESLCRACDQEAIRLVKEGPAWRPALQQGYKKITAQTYVDVNF